MKKKQKRVIKITVIVIVILIALAILIYNLFSSETISFSPSAPTQVKINVGNAAPSIRDIQVIPNVNLNPSPSTTAVSFTFTARDSNGANDLVDSSTTVKFNSTGEPTRTGTCSYLSGSGKEKTYQCTVNMNYYDRSGSWTANISVADNKGAIAEGSTQLTVNLLRDLSINPSIVNFPTLSPGDTNVLSTDNTLITNNGNFEATSGNAILITAYNLVGETNPSEYIPASNFRVAGSSQTDVCAQGNSLAHSASTSTPSSTLRRGASGNTETIKYCLTSIPDLSSQAYSATGGQSWVIAIN